MNNFGRNVTFVYDRQRLYNSPMNKRPDITEQTRKNLVSAFWTLYMDKPVSRISVREITDLAGYNRATFYHYFADVYQLLEEEEASLLKQVSDLFETAAKDEDMELPEKIGEMLVVLRDNNRFASALLSDHGDPAFVKRLKDLLWPYITTYFIQMGDVDPYQAELLKEFYLSGIFGTVRKWLEDPQIRIDEMIELLIGQIMRMPA